SAFGRVRMRRWARWLLVAVVLVGVLGVPSSASAISLCPERPAPYPDVISDHAPWWTPKDAPDDSGASGENFPGTHWTAGMKWHTVQEGCIDSLTAQFGSFHDMLWNAHLWFVNLVMVCVYAALYDETLNVISHSVSDVIEALKTTIFAPLLGTVVFLGAVWMAWVGLLKRRATMTMEGAGWMVLATTLGIWMMASPSTFYGLTNSVANLGASGAT